MANPIGGRQPDPGQLGRQIGDHGRAISQLQRLMANRPKIPNIAGSVMGTTRVYVGNPTTSVTFGPISTITWDGDGAVFEESGGTAPALTWTDQLRVVDAGFYCLTMRGRFWWTIDGTEPTWATADFRGDSNADSTQQGFAPYVKGSQREIEIAHQFGGPWYLAAGDALGANVRWQGSADINVAIGQPFLDVTRIG